MKEQELLQIIVSLFIIIIMASKILQFSYDPLILLMSVHYIHNKSKHDQTTDVNSRTQS